MSIDNFWSDDFTILFDKKKISEFFPTSKMSMNEILNSLVRASVYLSICLFIYKRNVNVFFIVIGTMVITYIIFKYRPVLSSKSESSKNASDANSGSVAVEEFDNYDNILKPKVCVTSTIDNPFMNVSLSDYTNMPNRDVCDDMLDNPVVKEQIEKNFNYGLYQDVGDVWGKNNGQRQFYTMPNTSIPNKQKEFALWLYNRGPTYKEGNGYQCYSNLHNPLRMKLDYPHKGTGPVT